MTVPDLSSPQPLIGRLQKRPQRARRAEAVPLTLRAGNYLVDLAGMPCATAHASRPRQRPRPRRLRPISWSSLERYHAKRDFSQTKEPKGAPQGPGRRIEVSDPEARRHPSALVLTRMPRGVSSLAIVRPNAAPPWSSRRLCCLPGRRSRRPPMRSG
jgi:hypothetical protein